MGTSYKHVKLPKLWLRSVEDKERDNTGHYATLYDLLRSRMEKKVA